MKSVYFFILALIFSSCTYKPTDEYFRDIKQPVPPVVTYSNSFGGDTLVTTGASFDVTFDAGSSYKSFKLDVKVDGVKKYSTQSNTGTFTISASSLASKSGIFNVEFLFYFSTNSGSIADIVGAEVFAYQEKMILVYTDYWGGFSPHLTFQQSAGNLLCTMTVPPDAPLIRKIDVSRYFGYDQPTPLTTLVGYSPFNFYDNAYVGEEVTYKIKTYIGNDEGTYFLPFSQGSTSKTKEITAGTYTLDDKGLPTINWQKTNYPQNCGGYRIYCKEQNGDLYQAADITNLDQTSLANPDLPFPGNNNVYISHVPKNPPSNYSEYAATEYYAESFNLVSGLSSFSYDRMLVPVGDDFFITTSFNKISRYSAQTMTITDQLTTSNYFYTVKVSPNGKYLLAATGSTNADYLLYDITTRNTTYISSSQVYGQDVTGYGVSIADNGIATVATNDKIILYDFVHNQKLTELSFILEPSSVISPSGKYFFVESDKLYLYGYSGGTVTEIWNSGGGTTPYKYYSFDAGDDNKALVIENETFSVRNSSNWNLLRSFTVNLTNIGNLDFNSGRLFGYDAESFRIYDYNSGAMLKAMRLGYGNPTALKFRSNTLFCGEGKKLILF